MRKLSSYYSVTFSLMDDKGKFIYSKRTNACYSELYRYKGMKESCVLNLYDFLAEETSEFADRYIKRISKICGLQLKFIKEDEIELTGFKDIFYLKLFTSLFRILFEVMSTYGASGEQNIKNTIEFFNIYIKERNNSGYKDMLERLTYAYSKSKCYHGSCHGITKIADQVLKIKSIKDLNSYEGYKSNNNMQAFFLA